MSLANLGLALFLISYAIIAFEWLILSPILVGIFAIIAGGLLLLAELNVYPARKV